MSTFHNSIPDYHSQQSSHATRMSPPCYPDSPRKSKQAQDTLPPFPAPGIVLHPEDATSKVFLAIGRSLMSVDNRAMTIKDLSEMSQKFGLLCQNVSAASQAITTYIRQHLSRCDDEQDHPLLLRHTLSGTRADDDLLPALHSRSGGSSCPVDDDRATNFRRGTTVWYLSRATGAPCPFARANIRLCDYAEPPMASSSKDIKRTYDRLSRNLKRKRPTRSCNVRHADDGKSDATMDGPPPPKVKLTLKFQPRLGKATLTQVPAEPVQPPSVIDLSDDSDSDSDSMSVDEMDGGEQPWSLPPYPRRSITIPCYTPTCESLGSFFFNDPSRRLSPRPRSPSLPLSIPSPPPDSDDDEYFSLRHSLSDAESDFDADSPGPRSPSEQPELDVAVKEEPRLSEWLDHETAVKVESVGLDLFSTPVKEEPRDFTFESDRDSSPLDSSSYDPVTPSPHFTPRRFNEFLLSDWDLSDSHAFRQLDLEDELGLESGFSWAPPLSSSKFSFDKRQMSEPLETPSLANSLSFMLRDMSMKSPTETVPPVPPVHGALTLPTQLSDPDLSSHTAESTRAIVSLLAGLDKPNSGPSLSPSSSMTEQELFQEFCCIPDERPPAEEEAEQPPIVVDDDPQPTPPPAPAPTAKPAKPAPIRRSKRVANAIAARSSPVRTRRSTRSSTA